MKQLLLLVLTLMLMSCHSKRYEKTYSDILTEQGFVVAKQYQGVTTSTGNTVGISSNGQLNVGFVSMSSPKKFDVVFTCEHKVLFTINDSKIYGQVRESDSVTIFYKEVYRGGVLYDYEFIDVIPNR